MMVSVRRSSIDLYRPAKQLGRIAKTPLLQGATTVAIGWSDTS
jgi:hypothetical protein